MQGCGQAFNQEFEKQLVTERSTAAASAALEVGLCQQFDQTLTNRQRVKHICPGCVLPPPKRGRQGARVSTQIKPLTCSPSGFAASSLKMVLVARSLTKSRLSVLRGEWAAVAGQEDRQKVQQCQGMRLIALLLVLVHTDMLVLVRAPLAPPPSTLTPKHHTHTTNMPTHCVCSNHTRNPSPLTCTSPAVPQTAGSAA
jgi:hypothetical protein